MLISFNTQRLFGYLSNALESGDLLAAKGFDRELRVGLRHHQMRHDETASNFIRLIAHELVEYDQPSMAMYWYEMLAHDLNRPFDTDRLADYCGFAECAERAGDISEARRNVDLAKMHFDRQGINDDALKKRIEQLLQKYKSVS